MKNNIKPLLLLFAVCSLSTITFAVIALTKGAFYNTATALIDIVAIIVGFIYVVKNAGKDSRGFYKLFMGLYALGEMISLISWAIVGAGDSYIRFALILTNFAMLMALAFGKDLGEKNTMMIICEMLLIAGIVTLISIIRSPGMFRGGDAIDTVAITINGMRFDMTALLLFMAKGKYIDKASRGTK